MYLPKIENRHTFYILRHAVDAPNLYLTVPENLEVTFLTPRIPNKSVLAITKPMSLKKGYRENVKSYKKLNKIPHNTSNKNAKLEKLNNNEVFFWNGV